MNKRRTFGQLALGALLSGGGWLAPVLSAAESGAAMKRVGFVAPQGRALPLFDAFRQGLEDLGYVDGRNIVIEA